MRTALAVFLVCGCASVDEFRPYSAVKRKLEPLVEVATFAYEGDVAILKAAGALKVGEFALRTPGAGNRDSIRERALLEAAAVGGTHVFIDRETGQGVSNETGSGDPSAPIVFGGVYVVVRVPEERWQELPDGLRPPPRITQKDRCDHPELSSNWQTLTALQKRDVMRECRASH